MVLRIIICILATVVASALSAAALEISPRGWIDQEGPGCESRWPRPPCRFPHWSGLGRKGP